MKCGGGRRGRCGALIDQGPFMKKMEKGMDPDKAWRESREEVEKKTRYGTWQADMFLHGPDSSGEFCHMMEIKCGPATPPRPAPLPPPLGSLRASPVSHTLRCQQTLHVC